MSKECGMYTEKKDFNVFFGDLEMFCYVLQIFILFLNW